MATAQASNLLRHLHQLRAGHDLSDGELLRRFAARHDEAAFEALLRRHAAMVLRVCRCALRHEQDAEDAFQATFLILARRAGSVCWRDSVANWLHGVARRVARKARDAAQRRRHHEAQAPVRTCGDPLAELTVREARAILDEELGRLPQRYRAPLVLCYLEGQTQDEAARQLGWSKSTCRRRLERGRELLRARLARRGLALSAVLLPSGLTPAAPAALIASTVRAALAPATAGVVSAAVLNLADAGAGVFSAVKMTLAAVVLAVCLAAGAGAMALQGESAKPPPPTPRRTRDEAPPRADDKRKPRTDRNGDPLPKGALHRFGSARFRHGGKIHASALSPDGKTLATAGAHSVVIWDSDTGKALHRFHCDHGSRFVGPGLAFSPDGTRLGYVRGWGFACVWDLRTGKELRRFERRFKDGLDKFFNGYCRFADGGKELVLLSRTAIETWDIESGKQTASVPVKASLLSPDGKTYLRSEGAKGLSLGDARTGKEVKRLPVEVMNSDDGLTVSPDGKTLALVHARKEIQLRDAASGKVRASFPLPDSARRKITGDKTTYWEYRLAFSTDGKTVLLGTYGGIIHRWDVATGKERPPLSKHHCAVRGMHTLPDGRTLVSTGADGIIRRWDLQTGRHDAGPECYEGRTCAAYSTDGRFAAIGDARGRIDLWDGKSGKLVHTLQREGTAVIHLAFAPDGKLLAAAERSGTVRFWQVPSGRPGAVWRRKPARGEWFCNEFVFSPDGRLLCVNDYPKQIRVVEVTSGKLLWTGQNAYGQAFSPDGATLLIAAPTGSYLTMLDATTGKKRTTVRLNTKIPDGLGVMYTLAFSPDGRRLAVAQSGGTLMLCDGRTGAETQRLADHTLTEVLRIEQVGGKPPNQIGALAFSPDGKWFASAGTDTALYIWETATGQEVLRLPGHEAEVSTVAFSPDGRKVFSHGQDGQGYLWNLKPMPAAGPPALNELWADLAETNTSGAYRAVWALSQDPRALGFLRKKIAPVKPVKEARLKELIADLDSKSFAVRDTAAKALREIGRQAAPAMEKALKGQPPLEVRRRLQGLLDVLEREPRGEELRLLRAVQALELTGTEEARKLLRRWAGGAPGALLTRQAKAALKRLEK